MTRTIGLATAASLVGALLAVFGRLPAEEPPGPGCESLCAVRARAGWTTSRGRTTASRTAFTGPGLEKHEATGSGIDVWVNRRAK